MSRRRCARSMLCWSASCAMWSRHLLPRDMSPSLTKRSRRTRHLTLPTLACGRLSSTALLRMLLQRQRMTRPWLPSRPSHHPLLRIRMQRRRLQLLLLHRPRRVALSPRQHRRSPPSSHLSGLATWTWYRSCWMTWMPWHSSSRRHWPRRRRQLARARLQRRRQPPLPLPRQLLRAPPLPCSGCGRSLWQQLRRSACHRTTGGCCATPLAPWSTVPWTLLLSSWNPSRRTTLSG
mmetsp:Transcript_26058/g.56888  ORF Transcript_26058/g.56888 Transcript_26058/m.56888 type:complete len:234 (+) Transcript_26058:2041-2742(+)